MRIAKSPEFAPDYLAFTIQAEKSLEIAAMRKPGECVEILAPEMDLSIRRLSDYRGKLGDVEFSPAHAVAEFQPQTEHPTFAIWLPDEWVPRTYFTRVPISPERIALRESGIVVPPKGFLLRFNRSLQPDSMYDLFPRQAKKG